MTATPGNLVLVVGPSGVGKDTLIRGAQAALAHDPRFVFVRRIVTRQADAALEDHDTLDIASFLAQDAAGQFGLSWRAHDLCYALPLSVLEDVAAGKIVIANGSRQIIAQAREKFPHCVILLITADAALRAQRLAQRGRENQLQVGQRLAREAPPPPGIDAITIDNSGTPALGIAALVQALDAIANPTR